MTTQEELLEAFRGLPPLRQQQVLELAQRLLHAPPALPSLFARARKLGVVGIVKDAPPDLSTNKDYFDRFGRD